MHNNEIDNRDIGLIVSNYVKIVLDLNTMLLVGLLTNRTALIVLFYVVAYLHIFINN